MPTTNTRISIAHRGLWDENTPENSLGAFRRCIEEAVPIELDVHLTKDEELVVFHDDNLKRMTGIDRRVKDCTYDELKDYNLLNTDYKIPRFSEVLDLVRGRVLIDIEIKCDSFLLEICRQLATYLDDYDGLFLVKSFSPYHISWFRFHRPTYCRGLLVSKLNNTDIPRILKILLFKMKFNFLCKPNFIAFDHRELPNKKIERLRKKGMKIYLWTIRDEKYDDYYDGIIYEKCQ